MPKPKKSANRRQAPLWGRKQKFVDRLKDALVLASALVLLSTQFVSCVDQVQKVLSDQPSPAVEVEQSKEPEKAHDPQPSKAEIMVV